MDSPELNLIMPLGSNFGWGVCGRYLAKEIHRIAKIHLITDSISLEKIGDENDYHFLKKMEMTKDEIKNVANPDGELSLESPVLQAIEGENLVGVEPTSCEEELDLPVALTASFALDRLGLLLVQSPRALEIGSKRLAREA